MGDDLARNTALCGLIIPNGTDNCESDIQGGNPAYHTLPQIHAELRLAGLVTAWVQGQSCRTSVLLLS